MTTAPADGPFAGSTALVTGAGGDIGRATAVRLAADGARLVLADLGGDLDATSQACLGVDGQEPIQLRFDVTDEDDVANAIGRLVEAEAVPDLLFNNAGYQGDFCSTVDYDAADFARVLQINVQGVFHVLKHTAAAMIDTGRPGSIVNTASMAKGGAPNMVAYSASKAAVVALTKSAAKDLAPYGIRVNSISPAFIGPGAMWDRQVELQASTPSQYFGDDPADVAAQMIGSVPLRRYGSLEEVASTAAFLLSGASSYITAFDIEISGGAV